MSAPVSIRNESLKLDTSVFKVTKLVRWVSSVKIFTVLEIDC